MNIFTKIKNSIYNPKYYGEVLEKPFSYFLKYYLLFALLFSLVFTIVVTVMFIPVVKFLSDDALQMANFFPQELVVNFKNGKASTNVQEPYFIKVPEYLKSNNANTSIAKLDNVIVIDTKDKFDIDTFYSYKTFMLLTSDSIVYTNQNGQISINPISAAKDFTLNKDVVMGFANKIKPFFVFLYPIVFVFAYIVGFLIVISKMIYLFFGALLIWLVAIAKGVKLGYKKSYKLGLHLMTAAIIITSILTAISNKFTFTFLFSILLIISALINLKKDAALPAISTPIA